MPIPLMTNKKSINTPSNVDYSILMNQLDKAKPHNSKIVTASDKDASLILKLWETGEKVDGNDTFRISDPSFNRRDLARLSANGLIQKCEENVFKITRRGKIIITTMALSEPNQFQIKSRRKNYNEILAGMGKKGNGYRIPKFSSSQSNNLRLS